MEETKVVSVSGILNITTVFFALAFFIPFLISGPQILTGIVVNALLYLAAVKLNPRSWEVMTILPSVGAFAHGIVFGPQTMYLFYFLPFIWISNNILVLVFRAKEVVTSTSLRIILASFLKAVFLFSVATLYVHYKIVPQIFITAMGLVQLVTALVGGTVAVFVLRLVNKKKI